VNEDRADVQRAQDRDIQQQVWEVVIGDDGAIDGDDECLFPKPGDVAEDAPQVGRLHEIGSVCMFPQGLRKVADGARPKFTLNLTADRMRRRMHAILPMTCTTTPERVAALWNLLRTPELPELDQRSRAGVVPCRQLEVRLRSLCAELGLGPETTERVLAAGLLYHDHHNEAHDLVQDMTDPEGAVIHAIVHRREPDFWNARYW